MLHKQVLARNVSIKVHDLCCDLTSLYPIEVLVYHIRGTRNISDYNSKLPTDLNPIKLINSEEWRQGLPEFITPDFPPQDCVFLKFAGGKVAYFKQPVIDRPETAFACDCHGTICFGLHGCDCRECVKILEEELAASALHAAAAQPTAQLKPEPAQGDDLLGLDIIKYVPLLPSNAIDDLLTRFNLVQVIRLLGRLAPIAAHQKSGRH